ncbi:transglycosylase family protein [Nakamurella endophytica]|uniref:Resuscitation-promoting factor core lysozyme-like domain-containing protein n=1 Tax=Nakamurella endophytica TaxID=1748367 RepID=A0A917WIB8_9ACTN|nr:transglycosylase family protein [Nakamurella endophytica]GGM08578.1 hypothetical protein GCM10011594_30620 [Nakamurella endophytica]
MRRTLSIASAVALAAASMLVAAGTALADPSADAWASVRKCESSGNYGINTGNGYYGAYQFDVATWRSVGGTGLPSDASPAEQDYRALYLYRLRGWSPWICAALSGVTEDSSARSGRVPTRAEAAYMSGGSASYSPVDTSTCRVGSTTAPPWGGVAFTQGHTYRDLTCWQRQLGQQGYGLQGSGYFGANTLAALHRFQAAKGLPASNSIDQRAWVAAWGTSGGVKPGVTPVPAKPAPAKPAPTKPAPAKPAPAKPAPAAPAVAVWPGLTKAACHVGAATAPAWPGKSWTSGAYDRDLACWQMQMGARGYDLHGNGWFGANTLAAAKDLQNRNRLGGSGLIGPKTWKAAWEGKARR